MRNPQLEQEENRNKTTAAFSTAGIAVLILCLVFFVGCWEAPGPPWPDTGVMVDFGNQDFMGSESETENETEQESQEVTEEVDDAEEASSAEETQEEVQETEVVNDEVVSDVADMNGETQVANESSSNAQETNESENIAEETQNTNSSSQESNDPDTFETGNFGNTDDPVQGYTAEDGQFGGGNNGNNDFGSQGWRWDQQPVMPQVPHPGQVEAEIKVNDLGKVVSVVLKKNPYPHLEQQIIEAIKKQQMVRLSGHGGAKSRLTTGTATFQFKGQ